MIGTPWRSGSVGLAAAAGPPPPPPVPTGVTLHRLANQDQWIASVFQIAAVNTELRFKVNTAGLSAGVVELLFSDAAGPSPFLRGIQIDIDTNSVYCRAPGTVATLTPIPTGLWFRMVAGTNISYDWSTDAITWTNIGSSGVSGGPKSAFLWLPSGDVNDSIVLEQVTWLSTIDQSLLFQDLFIGPTLDLTKWTVTLL